MKVLITGGGGFIGSTIASRCADAGIDVVILDNLVTGRIEFAQRFPFYRGDIADEALVDTIFVEHPDIEATVHCAALIVVGDSVTSPVAYYDNNVVKALTLISSLLRNGCTRFLFSSSAAVYASDDGGCVEERSVIAPQSPYARSKAHFESMLADIVAATNLSAVSLRYFNPVGTDPELRSGLQSARPTHALGKLFEAHTTGTPFAVAGTDWPTRDGSGVRDYVHVWDLADAHIRALERFDRITADSTRTTVVNLGSGRGTTVWELVRAFEEVLGHAVVVRTSSRRPGDTAGAYASNTLAAQLLGWVPSRTLEAGIEDTARWLAVRESRLTWSTFHDAHLHGHHV
ncbi:UDP-glucose 4-epimerase GalE [Rhodococcus sp. ARC_M6]|uniref:UDP-glucose 4-epimerase GalE n=1 Tax=Rhodococcus sp. ARC_M6 TaxID=2928852 RepID=UPI001FB2189D|nr:UDP-glucose 4-epimerase GalE [Rhodococcus sp. ARC_M6]MCJ0907140.1 UDP-glucose 4-epimerase GalE [Rhodococcus sp. ARC_M6]